MRIREVSGFDVEALTAMPGGPGVVGMTRAALRAEFAAGRMRPEWAWLACDDTGALVGRAVWWGRDATTPIALEVLDVSATTESRLDIASALLRAGHEGLRARGVRMPLPHTVRLPLDWRDSAAAVHALTWRREACAAVGLSQVNERLQFEWTADLRTGVRAARLTFRPGSDAEFSQLFSEAASGSLDVLTQRTLATSTLQQLGPRRARVLSVMPWRTRLVARRRRRVRCHGRVRDPVGYAPLAQRRVPRRAAALPRAWLRRGPGGLVTDFHRVEGATRVTATTDAVNVPMAAAFRRCGYRHVETRVELEPP